MYRLSRHFLAQRETDENRVRFANSAARADYRSSPRRRNAGESSHFPRGVRGLVRGDVMCLMCRETRDEPRQRRRRFLRGNHNDEAPMKISTALSYLEN